MVGRAPPGFKPGRTPKMGCNRREDNMAGDMSMPRRAFLGGVAALGAMSGVRMPAHAAVSPSVANLPARSNVVIRNAYVMTMEPGQPDLPNGDVHVDNGLIVDVGTGLAAPSAQIIEGGGFLVIPSLNDNHWNMSM